MRPIAIASLAAITGLFVLLDSRAGDQRVALAGLRNGVLLTAPRHTGHPRASRNDGLADRHSSLPRGDPMAHLRRCQHPPRIHLRPQRSTPRPTVRARRRGLLGASAALHGPRHVQSPMLHPRNPPRSPDCYPGYGGSRVLFDGALTRGVDETGPLLLPVAFRTVRGRGRVHGHATDGIRRDGCLLPGGRPRWLLTPRPYPLGYRSEVVQRPSDLGPWSLPAAGIGNEALRGRTVSHRSEG